MLAPARRVVGIPRRRAWVRRRHLVAMACTVLLLSHVAYAAPPPLALANVYEEDISLGGYWVSEKFDGVRAYWDGTQLTSRQGNRISAPAWFIASFPQQPLDGELWMGRGTFDALSGAVRRVTPDDSEWAAIRYMVFDMHIDGRRFDERYARLQATLGASRSPHLGLVLQLEVGSASELNSLLAEVVATGGEGLMLRRFASHSLAGRSDDLLKVKPYEDAEATVVGYSPGRGKYTGMVGALLVETSEGLRFRLGSGLSDAQRRSPPPIGAVVTFKFHGKTSNGIPRFASFLRVRAEGEAVWPDPAIR